MLDSYRVAQEKPEQKLNLYPNQQKPDPPQFNSVPDPTKKNHLSLFSRDV